jgi:hypothetical protein
LCEVVIGYQDLDDRSFESPGFEFADDLRELLKGIEKELSVQALIRKLAVYQTLTVSCAGIIVAIVLQPRVS